MDPRLLDYYNQELAHLREVGAEFAGEYPKIAGRLGLEEFECADPYVERLLEGFAFLTARIRLRMDAEFPRFTQHLLQKVYPHYLSPTPSMTVVQLQPQLDDGGLAEGVVVPRHSALRSKPSGTTRTICRYRTGHTLALWPLKIASAEYFSSAGAVATLGVPDLAGVKAGLRIRLQATAGLKLAEIKLEQLQLYLHGGNAIPARIYEQLLGNSVAVVALPRKGGKWCEVLDKSSISSLGFEDDQALLPYTDSSFQGYRLLQEYFAFPQRFSFVSIDGLKRAFSRSDSDEMDLVFLFDRSVQMLDRVVDAENFKLHCTTAINLFPHGVDRIDLRKHRAEYHVIPDRTRPMDLEIFSVDRAVGYGSGGERESEFRHLYASSDLRADSNESAFFTLRREPRLLSSKQRRDGPRSTYVGSEVFIALVDANEAPYSSDLRQLAVETLCTNRDLPLHMAIGQGGGDFSLEASAPVQAVRCLAGPTRPQRPLAQGNTTWRLISHLSLNYLSLADNDKREGAGALRELLSLYSNIAEAAVRKQIDGVRHVAVTDIVRRLPVPGPVSFGRGLQISLHCDESAFEGAGVFMLGAVLERFFSRYASLNSFTETVVETDDRGEIMRWPARIGQQHRL